MSRAIPVAEEWTPSAWLDREALMLDEPRVFYHNTGRPHNHTVAQEARDRGPTTPPPEEDEGDEGGNRVVSGMRLQISDGSWWKVVDIGGHQLRLAPIDLVVNPANRLTLPAIPSGAVFRTENQKEITLDNQGNILFTRTLRASEVGGGGGGGGGGGSREMAYGSTQAAQTQAEEAALAAQTQSEAAAAIRQAEADAAAADRLATQLEAEAEEARKQRDWATAERKAGEAADARAAELAAKNRLKLARLSEAGALARTFEDIKARARDVIAGMMGKNPFRGAVRAQGGIPRGVDPYEKFEAELKGVANMPTPQFSSESDLGQLESAITAMNQAQMPTATWPRGMAGGGRVRPGEVVEVGELGAEYVYNRGGGIVEIIPKPRGRIAGRAQGGGTYSFERSPWTGFTEPGYDWLNRQRASGLITVPKKPPIIVQVPKAPPSHPHPEDPGFEEEEHLPEPPPPPPPSAPPPAIPQALGPVYNYLGFNEAPVFEPGPMGSPMSMSTLQRLGIRPRLMREPNSGAIFYVDSQGVRRYIPGNAAFDEWGFDWNDVTTMSAADQQAMYGAEGSAWTAAPPLLESTRSAYPQQAVPLALPSELGGYALPDPRTIANLWRTFDPANRELLLDAFGISEMSRGQAGSLFEAFTPTGTAGRVGFG